MPPKLAAKKTKSVDTEVKTETKKVGLKVDTSDLKKSVKGKNKQEWAVASLVDDEDSEDKVNDDDEDAHVDDNDDDETLKAENVEVIDDAEYVDVEADQDETDPVNASNKSNTAFEKKVDDTLTMNKSNKHIQPKKEQFVKQNKPMNDNKKNGGLQFDFDTVRNNTVTLKTADLLAIVQTGIVKAYDNHNPTAFATLKKLYQSMTFEGEGEDDSLYKNKNDNYPRKDYSRDYSRDKPYNNKPYKPYNSYDIESKGVNTFRDGSNPSTGPRNDNLRMMSRNRDDDNFHGNDSRRDYGNSYKPGYKTNKREDV
jgi:hypothetical protein